MARKLPWASKTAPITTVSDAVTSTRPPPMKRRKISPSTDDASVTSIDDLDQKSKSQSTKTAQPPEPMRQGEAHRGRSRGKSRGKSRGRTPSTSPPPAPPDVKFMREGIDADDGYMMVEDEFNDTAKTFTAHLHHAEYKRLMKEAQERKQTQRADMNANGTVMSTDETRRRNVAKMLRSEQGQTIKDEDAEGEADDSGNEVMRREEQRVGDPWAGTTLAGLMRYEPGRDRLSLRGSQEMHSGSRAALGFGPNGDMNGNARASARTSYVDVSSTSSGSKNLEIQSLPLPQSIKKEKSDGKWIPQQNSVAATSSDNYSRTNHQAAAIVLDHSSDDLDTPGTFRTAHPKNTDNKTSNHSVKIKAERNVNTPTTTAASMMTTTTTTGRPTVIKAEPGQRPKNPPQRVAIRKFVDDLDDFDDALFDRNKNRNEVENIAMVTTGSSKTLRSAIDKHRSHTRDSKVMISKERIKEEDYDDGDCAAARKRLSERLDEVPVFLA